MSRGWLWWVPIALVAGACGRRDDIRVMAPPNDAQSIVVVASDNGALRAYGGDVGPFALPIDLTAGDSVFVGYYGRRIASGSFVEPVGPGLTRLRLVSRDDGASLAGHLAAWTRDIGADDDWSKVSGAPPPFHTAFIATDTSGCGVVSSQPLSAATVDCRPVTVEAPAAIDPPRAAKLPDLRCAGSNGPLVGQVETCAVYEPALVECAANEVFEFEREACAPLTDRDCETWPTADASAIYVREGAVGDGSRASPFGTLAEAAAMAAGGTVVLARGVYSAASVSLEFDLIGACAEAVVVDVGALTVGAPDVTVDGATLRLDALNVRNASLTVRDSRLEVRGAGIDVVEGRLELDRVVVSGLGQNAVAMTNVRIGGRLALSDVTYEDVNNVAIDIRRNATANLQGVWVRRSGAGIATVHTAQLTAQRVAITEVASNGLLARSTSPPTVSDLFVRDTGDSALRFVGASTVTLTRVDLAGSVSPTVSVLDSNLRVSDLRIGASPGAAPQAIHVRGSNVRIDRLQIVSPLPRIDVETATSVVALSDVVLTTTEAPLDVADAIRVMGGATLLMRRAYLLDLVGIAVVVRDATSRAMLEDLTVVGSRTASDGRMGRGLAVRDGAMVGLEGGIFRDIDGVGIQLSAGTLSLVDVLVDRVTAPDVAEPARSGLGISAGRGGVLELTRVKIEGAHRVALLGTEATIVGRSLGVRYPTRARGLEVFGAERAPNNTSLQKVSVLADDGLAGTFESPGAIVMGEVELSLLDAFVVGAWGEALRLKGRTRVLSDGLTIVDTTGRAVLLDSDVGGEIANLSIRGTKVSNEPVEAVALGMPNHNLLIGNFEILDTSGVAIEFQDVLDLGAPAMLRDGRITTCDVALAAASPSIRNLDFDDVQIRDCQRTVRTGEE